MDTGAFPWRTRLMLAMAPIVATTWHSAYTVAYLKAEYLLFICYPANILLGLGILAGSGILLGVGLGWTTIGLPLWLYDAIFVTPSDPSAVAMHVAGPVAGLLAARSIRIPENYWMAAVAFALVMQYLAWLFTDPALNVNAAFRVYEGWEWMFSDYRLYMLSVYAGFGGYLFALGAVARRYIFLGEAQ